MEIKCKVHEVGEEQQVTDTFRKRELIVQYAENPQFVEHIKFETTNDRVSIFDNLSPGDEVSVSFNLRGRPWTNKEGEIGRAHVCTPVTNAHLVCRHMLEKIKTKHLII